MKLKDLLKVVQGSQLIAITYDMSKSACYEGAAEYALKLNKYILNATVVWCRVYNSNSYLHIFIK